MAALLGVAVLTACSVTIGAPGGSGPSASTAATATASPRPLPADGIVPAVGVDLCTLLGPGFLSRYAPGYTPENAKPDPLNPPEDRVLRTERGGTGPQLSSGGCRVRAGDGPGGVGVTFTRALPGPNTSMSPEQRCALVATDLHRQEAAQSASLAPAFTFEDMPALGAGGFREVERENGRVAMARAQACRGADWVMLSIVPGSQGDDGRAPDDAVEALQDVFRRLGDA
ncbi:hypothetical protein [Kitasatospora terrestris]|uniref:DUF3558 domain-containing protein n=1 Tax=Kitasatospora terrestris TaxID=258051 RepID=A0ABP9DCM1_9ACTN